MKIAYFDCFAGISGDMTVGALLDAGLDLSRLEGELSKLAVRGYRLQAEQVSRAGIRATQFKVLLEGEGGERPADSDYTEIETPQGESPEHGSTKGGAFAGQAGRRLADILALIQGSALSARVKERACLIFTRLGEAEARVHGVALDQVHFHEVGGVDAIVDIVGTAIALELAGIEAIYASPLHLGSGFVHSQHGLLPVPAPATAELLAGAPTYSSAARGELVTPTGAALITSLASGFGPMPPMQVNKVAYGAGSRERDFPNVLRVFIGETQDGIVRAQAPTGSLLERSSLAAERRSREPFPEQHQAPATPAGYHEHSATVIEANIDDMNPQLFENLSDKLLLAGALDVTLIPVQMKKNRPGILLQVLAAPAEVETLLAIIFSESTSIGARTYPVSKHMLAREIHPVTTSYGIVRVKISRLGERIVNLAPEYEDCRQLAAALNVPLKDVLAEAQAVGQALLEH
jgi:pyridinium-3,5-bisthiocarboxylic acid mononucleotide nickel chelatase